MITPDDVDPCTNDDWYAGDDNDDRTDVTRCPFCLCEEQYDPSGRVIACCRAMAEAWEES